MTDLVEWLRAQLDEDERLARLAIGEIQDSTGVWTWTYVVTPGGDFKVVDQLGYSVLGHYDVCANVWDVGPHVAEHDPSRVLREVAAKRKLLAVHWSTDSLDSRVPGRLLCVECSTMNRLQEWVGREYPCATVRLLALPYSHRPGYLLEWAPAPL